MSDGRAYFNEIDPFAAQWLRNLIAAGLIAPGDVDERSIVDVRPDDLRGYTQCHFFAGIGIWSAALRAAGVPDDRPVWTGSCPCQPLSAAGKGLGTRDERHLWPVWFELIKVCRPFAIFGEQVASRDGLAWLDLVQADLEGSGYASGAVDICAAGFGAPHIRQRLYWMAYAKRGAAERHRHEMAGAPRGMQGASRQQRLRPDVGDGIATEQLADADNARSQGRPGVSERADQCAVGEAGLGGGMAYADGRNAGTERLQRSGQHGLWTKDCVSVRSGHQGLGHNGGPELDRPGPTNGHWSNPDWLLCRDGKWRPVESGTFPLAHGASSRVGRLRAYGNAIVLAQATEFIRAAEFIIAAQSAI